MKQIAMTCIVAVMLAQPLYAEERGTNPQIEDGLEMMADAFRLLLDGMSTEMEPLADAWQEFVDELGDLQNYEAPERLPNGDIIIRRKTDDSGTEL